MKRKWQLIIGLVLAMVVTSGLYAFTYLTATATMDVAVAGDEIATAAAAASPPDWNSVLGYSGIETLRPSAAGDETGTEIVQYPVAGEHWDKVYEETPDGDSTYIETEWFEWQEDLYNIPDHSLGSDTINYVKVYAVAKVETVFKLVTHLYIHIKTNGVEDNGPEAQITTSYATYSNQWNNNPQTGNPWTWDEIDALQIGVGIQRPKSGNYTRVTQVYAEVNYSTIKLSGEVPTGDLFDITPDDDYTGDLAVKVYLTNTGDLVKAYQYLNMKLYLEGSVEAGETPDYQLLTLDNGEATFNLKDYAPGTYTLSVGHGASPAIPGGSYGLVSTDTSRWEAGWAVEPEFYCLIMQR